MTISLGIEIVPEPGDLRLGIGLSFMEFHGVGLNTSVCFDFDDPKNIAHYIGLLWVPTFDDFKLNIGIEIAIGTPYYRMFQEYSVKAGIIFYVW